MIFNNVKLRFKISNYILSVVLSLLLYYGYIVDNEVSNAYDLTLFTSLLIVLLISVIVFVIITALEFIVYKTSDINKHIWIVIPLILFLGWIPYLVCSFPGSLCYDSMMQLRQIYGVDALSNHNPILDTFIYGILFKSGRLLFGTDNAGVTVIVIFQLVLSSLSFSYVLYQVYNLTKSKFLLFAFLILYILVPLFGCGMQVVLKDVLHLPFFTCMVCFQLDVIRCPSKQNCFGYLVMLILVSLTRAMAYLYAVIGCIGTLVYFLIYKKDKAKTLIAITAILIMFLILWNRILLPLLGIKAYPSEEKYSLPLQQISYVVHNQELTGDEVNMVNSFNNIETIRNEYNPNLADPVKWTFKIDAKDNLWRLYFSWWKKYPKDMVIGFFTSYYKYVYPFSPGYGNCRLYISDCSDMGLDIHYVNEKRRSSLEKYISTWENNPLLELFMGPGLYCCFLAYGFICFARNKSVYLIILLPLLVLFVGLFLTPLNGETRYAYPIIACVPLIISMAYDSNVRQSSKPDKRIIEKSE